MYVYIKQTGSLLSPPPLLSYSLLSKSPLLFQHQLCTPQPWTWDSTSPVRSSPDLHQGNVSLLWYYFSNSCFMLQPNEPLISQASSPFLMFLTRRVSNKCGFMIHVFIFPIIYVLPSPVAQNLVSLTTI